ncbi:hypothetical protein C9374_010148 [Naegleria lovaniensis]|uniref:VWFA domain-containing protein n=1 Tax=Naegleria lovaniensis TaxID=51637 RepID=A0AA88GH23_NAELO|nr:uncharacterized protein C9374_010148 [Naegleria lovaniensis]KAG2375144.1 hypothetical protein C9374_010148 [Naegleria lovaniensis]
MGNQISTGACNAANFYLILANQSSSSSRPLLPPASSLTFEGVMKTYFYKTGMNQTNKLLEANYSVAFDQKPSWLSPNQVPPASQEMHLAVGLHSSEDGKNERNDLNLVVVVDISGSMSSGFDETSSTKVSESSERRNKLQVAAEVLCQIIDSLQEHERIGVVLFDDKAEILQPLTLCSQLSRDILKKKICELRPRGGTNWDIGMAAAIDLFSCLDMFREDDERAAFQPQHSNRIVFLTDACPNIGGPESIDVLAKRANIGPYKIYTTYIGVGLDFNSEIVHELTKIRGSNYFSAHSSDEFKKILNDDFNYLVTPLCFDVKLRMESEDLEIEKVFGTPFSDQCRGELMKFETCSAGPKDEEKGVNGGIVLIRAKPKHGSFSNLNKDVHVEFILEYETLDGKKIVEKKPLIISKQELEEPKCENYYENSGVRKAIFLVRYVELVRDLLSHYKSSSSKVTIPDSWIEKLKQLQEYYEKESLILADENLEEVGTAIPNLISIVEKMND